MLFGSPFLLPRVPISLENWVPVKKNLVPIQVGPASLMYIGFALEKVQMVGWSNVDFKISTIDHNTYYCSMFIIPTTGQNPNWNSPVHIAFFKIPTAKIQLIIIPTTDQNPNRNFPVQIAFFIIPTSHNPYKVKSRTQLKSLRTQLKSLQTQLKSLRVGIMIVGILIVGILKPSRCIDHGVFCYDI